jgi:fructose-1,6-bisphosphatase I
MQLKTSLESYLSFAPSGASHNLDLCKTIISLVDSAKAVAREIPQNSVGDSPNSIEQIAFDLFEQQLSQAPVGMLFSEKLENPRVQNPESRLAVTIYPVEAAANIDSGMPCGSIFSIYQLAYEASKRDLSGANLLASGFFVYGSQTHLVMSCGKGTSVFTLSPESGEFMLSRERVIIPLQGREFTVDSSNYRFWHSSIRHLVDDCVAGSDGPLGGDFDMFWNESIVMAAYRILNRGGIYLCPDDARPAYKNGKHKLLYEAIPIAFLVEQAGGKATDGYTPILNRKVSEVDARVPLMFGAQDLVDKVLDYYSNDTTDTTRFRLFENRSLLRN